MFSVYNYTQVFYGFSSSFSSLKTDTVCKLLEEADRPRVIVFHVFGCFTGSLWTVVIQYHIYFTDWFCKGIFAFEIAKTKTYKFTVKFDLKLDGKNRTEYNLLD